MGPCVGSHAPSFGWQLWKLPSRVRYLSPQGVLHPRVYGTIASLLWLELLGLSAWPATPSWSVYRLLPWLRVAFAMFSDAAWPSSDQRPWGTALLLARWVGPVAPVRLTHGVWFVVSRPSATLGWHACAVFTAPWHVFTGACAWFVLCAVSWATWLLFTSVPARCVVLRYRCPGPLGSCSPVRLLRALCCVCGVLGHLALVHRCARSVCCVACVVSLATWLPFTCVPARCVVLRVRCLGPLC